nr:olfactory receptor 84 [Tropidothorax elegans]QQP19789.1 olfactory receptor 94 [Tropidothorax elegans]
MVFYPRQSAEGPFDWLAGVLRMMGMLEPSLKFFMSRYLLTAVTVSLQLFLILSSFCRFLEEDIPFSEQTEAALICVSNFHLFTKVVVLPVRRPTLIDLFSRIGKVLDECTSEPDFAKILRRNTTITKLFFFATVGNFTVMHLIANISSFVKYSKNIYSLPFQIYVPFDERDHFFLACGYCFAISVVPIINLGMTMSLLVCLVLNTSTCVEYLILRLTRLGGTGHQDTEDMAVRQAIVLHQEVIRIIYNLNELFSDLLYIEYLLSSLQICIAGYQVIVARSQSDPRTPVFMFIFLLTIVVPVFFNICGNKIKLESGRIFEACYDNSWYTLSQENRKGLVTVISVAGRTLSFSYRNLISFDMEQYSNILKTAYSLVAVLQMMDPKKLS